ncbi:hypothetical protein HKD37_20G056449 [Glycine soja]
MRQANDVKEALPGRQPNMASRKRKTRARADDIPSSSTPAPPSASAGPDAQSSQTASLQELAHQRPITNVEQFLEQLAWHGARPSIVRNGGSFTAQAPQQVRPDEAAPPEPTPTQTSDEGILLHSLIMQSLAEPSFSS